MLTVEGKKKLEGRQCWYADTHSWNCRGLSLRLLVAEASKLQAGAFYLDREPQVKHMAGRLGRLQFL